MTGTAVLGGYLAGVDAGNFDHLVYLQRVMRDLPGGWSGDERMLKTPAARRAATRNDPLLFALVYLRHLLKAPDGGVTFGDVHLGVYRDALELAHPAGPKESRRAYAAPRGSGKSTTAFLIVPLWVACHHSDVSGFIAAFSNSGTQAQDHLAGVRRELQSNELIRLDYPELCQPVIDSKQMLFTRSGFAFSARGIDSGVLGLVDPRNRRPAILLLDDIEAEEGAGYSVYQAEKRLGMLLNGILPMNDRAHVRVIGTTTLAGGIMHQLVKAVTEPGDPARWIAEERFRTTYFAPLVKTPDGGDRSVWPGRWPTAYLQSIRHTRVYAKAFANRPVRMDGDYWTPEDFRYGDVSDTARVILQIDPAVTDKKTSDFYGLAVVAYRPPDLTKAGDDEIVLSTEAWKPRPDLPLCVVRHAEQVKLPPAKLRDKVLALLDAYPEVGAVRIETNQGGDLWKSVLHTLPVDLLVHSESLPKQVRAATLLNHYQRYRVLHARPLPEAEDQMTSFPDVLNDDLIDAIGAGVAFFLDAKKTRLRWL
ncbi:hypothetical protein GCM10022254_09830 [Actinomadura meridiana]|uniref:Terminase n=1 Tax=Actinomadura meridiana TaxID=559626 RepID=A0ABP8BTS0_9ACTN